MQPMPLPEIVLIAVGLAMDAFAVSLGAGAGGHMRRTRPALRLAFHLGLFQFMMPVIGWYLGNRAAAIIAPVDHLVALILLSVVGGRMIRSGLSADSEVTGDDPSRGLTLVALSVATSIDAFAIGLSLAVLGVGIWYPSVVIGVLTALLSLVGIHLGKSFGDRLGSTAEVLGGLLLIGIGIKVCLEHMFFS
jgi:putative Mn2+ efflux pump MntP